MTIRHRAFAEYIPPAHAAHVGRWWRGFLDADLLRRLGFAADERSEKILRQNLSPAQRDQYDRHRYFDVVGGSTGTRYRIHYSYRLNVEEFDLTGKRARVLCFLPEGHLPIPDIMLAQKLALELFEQDALNVATKFRADPRRFTPSRHPIWG